MSEPEWHPESGRALRNHEADANDSHDAWGQAALRHVRSMAPHLRGRALGSCARRAVESNEWEGFGVLLDHVSDTLFESPRPALTFTDVQCLFNVPAGFEAMDAARQRDIDEIRIEVERLLDIYGPDNWWSAAGWVELPVSEAIERVVFFGTEWDEYVEDLAYRLKGEALDERRRIDLHELLEALVARAGEIAASCEDEDEDEGEDPDEDEDNGDE